MKNLTKRLLAGLLVAFLVVAQVSTIPDVAVMGGTNLTTVGAIPYVSASGTLSQDTPALHWDATNNRLGLGTASPTMPIEIRASETQMLAIRNGNWVPGVSGSGLRVDLGAVTGNTYGALTVQNTGGGSAGNLLLQYGGGSVGIGPSNTSPTGTLYVYDATATTGSTLLTVARGAAQTAASTVLDLNGVVKFGGTNTTGAGSALLGANSPAVTNTAPYTWIRAVSSDGSTVFIPAWK